MGIHSAFVILITAFVLLFQIFAILIDQYYIIKKLNSGETVLDCEFHNSILYFIITLGMPLVCFLLSLFPCLKFLESSAHFSKDMRKE
jgi:hypothetical protein